MSDGCLPRIECMNRRELRESENEEGFKQIEGRVVCECVCVCLCMTERVGYVGRRILTAHGHELGGRSGGGGAEEGDRRAHAHHKGAHDIRGAGRLRGRAEGCEFLRTLGRMTERGAGNVMRWGGPHQILVPLIETAWQPSWSNLAPEGSPERTSGTKVPTCSPSSSPQCCSSRRRAGTQPARAARYRWPSRFQE
jgi:hypothetical protein